jgi:hypothetical protein
VVIKPTIDVQTWPNRNICRFKLGSSLSGAVEGCSNLAQLKLAEFEELKGIFILFWELMVLNLTSK